MNVTITTYNKLIVNYDTYEFTPSSYSNIAIDNPWYINCESAPDFCDPPPPEQNTINGPITIAEDTYAFENTPIVIKQWQNQQLEWSFTDQTPSNHKDMVTTIFKTLRNNGGIVTSTNHYIITNINTNSDNWSSYYKEPDSITQHDSILFPVVNAYTGFYIGPLQHIPYIRTITITINSNDLAIDMPAHELSVNIHSSGNYSISIPEGRYTYPEYFDHVYNLVWNKSFPKGGNTYIYKYNYMPMLRNQLLVTGDDYAKSLYCKLYCGGYYSYNKINTNTLLPANSRCLHVPEGEWTADNLIAAVNSNSDDCLFTLSSDNKYIYIKSVFPFIINPVCKIITQDTDTSETFAKQHVLLKHPQVKHFTASCQYNGQTFQSENDYTPAEFLRWIHTVTNIKCVIHNDVIYCPANITVSDNPFFEFKENGTVVNRCGLSTMSYKVNITSACKIVSKSGYIDYNPVLVPYDTVKINDNITTTLNTSKVKLL